MTPSDVVQGVLQSAYGRLVGALARRTGDLAAAEDALSEAFAAALRRWAVDGVPDRPEAWLLVAARRAHGHAARHGRVREAAVAALRQLEEERAESEGAWHDPRLGLMFACAHPAVDAGARAPLMLQAVLALDAGRIAAAFLVSPAAMGQRLVRAKARLREAGVRFEVPAEAEWPERLSPVLDAIYAAHAGGWGDAASVAEGTDARSPGLTAEAIWLARLLAALLPGEAEAQGLLALLLHCAARRAARRGPGGEYVPLDVQDPRDWDAGLIVEAEAALRGAARIARARPGLGSVGRYQLEAAIQSAHAARRSGAGADPEAVALLYEGLVMVAPGLGALVGRAAAIGAARGAAAGLAALDGLAVEEPARCAGYQPYWAVRAHLLAEAGAGGAAEAYDRAIGLSEDPAVREFLLGRRAGLGGAA
ncbi:RNA polymerase sigma factor [Roseomonas sp. CCTCC AB2023176]|uniref:RNA polymerase sigma factor n=1 Tax=Roseomonas sp. CCTCC AB2023176 TaxID=3342640 RepID=UPI0035E34ED4